MKPSIKDLVDIAQQLDEMPEPPADERPVANKKEAVRLLREPIEKLRAKGYTPKQIAERLSMLGLQIATDTLVAYLGDFKAKRRRRKPETKTGGRGKGRGVGAGAGSPDASTKGTIEVQGDSTLA